jgi:hypothetical protein
VNGMASVSCADVCDNFCGLRVASLHNRVEVAQLLYNDLRVDL